MKSAPLWLWVVLGLAVVGGGGYVGATKLTRGYRNKNPGNIRYSESNRWQGQTGKDEAGFAIFSKDFYGLRAMARLLLNYERAGANTVRKIISRWAPATENNTAAYVNAVAGKLGVNPDAALMVAPRLNELIGAIVAHENFVNKYSRDEINAAIRAA